MKILKPKVLFIFCITISLVSCKKEKPVIPSALSRLNAIVPVTQSGAGRLGCLINTIDGEVFASTDEFLFPPKASAVYAPVYGYYELLIIAYRQTAPAVYATVTIKTDSLAIREGQTISLANDSSGKASASYDVQNYGAGGDDFYHTIARKPGKLYISYLDQTNDIVSGTFSFDAVNARGDTVHITNGRFDLQYRPY
jgi:hypothetical protein